MSKKEGEKMLPYFYHEKQRKRKKKILLGIAAGIFVLASMTVGFIFFRAADTENVLKPANEPTLTQNASLQLTTLYECGHSKTRLLPIPQELCGKTKEEATLLYPEWTVLEFKSSFLSVEQKDGAECDDHFLLFLEDNTIIVTKSKDKNEIITEQKINLELLTEEDLEILRSGIFINSEYELLEILESFQ